ncbi:restriction endonuclease subunit S [Pseudarthrobacter sp. J1738]|uniref:restriction endonuclease subunit S n=1 Tax=Pseudarthrobacter sp. J1738 TaxID=3420446 RepID=UPI003D27BC19
MNLSDVARVNSGYMFKSTDWRPEGVPVIKIGNVKAGFVDLSGCSYVDEQVAEQAREYEVSSSDIVIAMTGYVGEVAVVGNIGKALLNQRVGRFVVTSPDRLSEQFLFYFLRQTSIKDELIARAHGSAQPNLSNSAILALAINLPELSEQQAIAEVLGALDDKIAANTKLAATADELAASLVRRATDGAETISLVEIATLVMGSSPAGTTLNESGEGVVFYQGVRDFGFRFPSNRIWTTSPVRMATAGDTLISVRAPVGRVNRANEDVCIGRGVAAATSKTGHPNLLFHLLNASKSIWEPFEAEGTVFGSINKKQLESIQLPQVEDESVMKLESSLQAIEDSISSALAEVTALRSIRDSLLPQLMSGKLRVKEATEQLESLGV